MGRGRKSKGGLLESESPAPDEDNVMFSQQAPELSQPILPARDSEKMNLTNLERTVREEAIRSLSRLLLFKAFAGEPIDRLKCAKEARLSELTEDRITNAVFDEAAANLRNVFGFDLRRVPIYMEQRKNFPKKFKDRFYVVNTVCDDQAGSHSKAIHSVHAESSIEKGLLMVILALTYCKGDVEADGSRWIWDHDLYRLLHSVDENIPEDPPSTTGKASASQSRSRAPRGSMTPDVDKLLDKFVKMEYLLKDARDNDSARNSTQQSESAKTVYSMGPRAAVEIGRRQVIYFSAEILDEEPDPTMLAEIEEDIGED